MKRVLNLEKYSILNGENEIFVHDFKISPFLPISKGLEFLNEFRKIDTIVQSPSLTYRFIFTIVGDKIEVEKNGNENKVICRLNEEIAEKDFFYLLDSINIPVKKEEWVNAVIDGSKVKIISINDVIKTIYKPIELKFPENLKNSIENAKTLYSKLLDFDQNIKLIQNLASKQKDFENEKKLLESEKKKISDKIETIKSLLDSKSKVSQKLVNLQKNSIRDDAKVIEIQNRVNSLKLNQALKEREEEDLDVGTKRLLTGKIIIPLVFIVLIITILIVILTRNPIYLISGLSFIILLILVLYYLNFNYREKIKLKEIDSKIDEDNAQLNDPFKNPYVQNSYFNAIEKENEILEKEIVKRLRGENPESLVNDLKKIDERLIVLQQELNKLSNNKEDDLYKLRREFDILSIEFENIEKGFKDQVDTVELRRSVEKSELILPVIFINFKEESKLINNYESAIIIYG